LTFFLPQSFFFPFCAPMRRFLVREAPHGPVFSSTPFLRVYSIGEPSGHRTHFFLCPLSSHPPWLSSSPLFFWTARNALLLEGDSLHIFPPLRIHKLFGFPPLFWANFLMRPFEQNGLAIVFTRRTSLIPSPSHFFIAF